MILDLRRIRRTMAPLIFGTLIGMTIGMLRLGEQVDNLVLDNARLMDEVERLSSKAASLEESLGQKRLRPVKEVEITVSIIGSPENPRHQLILEQRLNDVLSPVVGQEVDEVAPDLVQQLISREIKVDDEVYAIKPDDWIIISDVVRIRVSATSLSSSKNLAPF